jgi:CoA:oxalate CoA-transferase
MMELPLKDIVVLEFSQYLSGPSAGLRLADLGARVIKIEKPGAGDAGRKLAIKNLWVDESSLLFHTINRNKESFTANLKDGDDLSIVKKLIAKADVLIHNFRPGVMQKTGLDFATVRAINPRMIYAEISGYGNEGPWKAKPGQDLLLQSMTGLAYTTGNGSNGPVPFGIAIADILAGSQLVQGILAALTRRQKKGVGALVQVSLAESLLDFQFELLTTYYASKQQPQRSFHNNGHPLLSAPYGLYETANGYIGLAMMEISTLAHAIECKELNEYANETAFAERDTIKAILAKHLLSRPTQYWLKKLQDAGLWAMEVFDWEKMRDHDAYKVLQMEQQLDMDGKRIVTTRCPIRINGERLYSNKPAPAIGQHNTKIKEELESSHGGIVRRDPIISLLDSKQETKQKKMLLEDILVVDFSQFLSGPSASLRLADMGAQVIKIEKPGSGDICRQLYVSDVMVEGESTIFHAINRNKQSYAADLKDPDDLDKIKQLLAKADVMIHNFRPGVMERIGLDYETVKSINPTIIYGEVNGFGTEGPWKDLPGQDLLLQSCSGLTWLSNNNNEHPTPMGVAVVDIMAGTHLAQGILASLYKKEIDGEGSLVQVSMFESILDFQFEVLTCYLNDGNQLPVRSAINSGHAYIAAPYGIYKTKDGYIALAMTNILSLAEYLMCMPLKAFTNDNDWFDKRDEIKGILAAHLRGDTCQHWLDILEKADIWCALVMDYDKLMKEEGYRVLNMEITVKTSNGLSVKTTRCPIRVDGNLLRSEKGAPVLGEDNGRIDAQFGLVEVQSIIKTTNG